MIGTGKRTGKTAVAGHWAGLLRAARPGDRLHGARWAGRADGGRRRHRRWRSCSRSSSAGGHGASDYLEDAVLAGVRTVGLSARGRRAGGCAVGVQRAGRRRRSRRRSRAPGALIFEGSGACIPPVEVDRTVCVIGPGPPGAAAPSTRCCGPTAAARARGRGGAAGRAALLVAARARGAAAGRRAGGPVHDRRAGAARAWSRWSPRRTWRGAAALAADLDRAAAAGCDVYLTELKAAAIDTVARRAAEHGAPRGLRAQPTGRRG